jgi:transposase
MSPWRSFARRWPSKASALASPRCGRFFERWRITLKKDRACLRAGSPRRPDAARAWFEGQPDLDPQKLVFIDETAATTKMGRLYGRAPRGERLRAGVPHGHWNTITFVGALRPSGMIAPMLLEGPMIHAWFLAYVLQVLVPTLRPGDIVVLDNLAAHKGAAARRQSRQSAPPYYSSRPIPPSST